MSKSHSQSPATSAALYAALIRNGRIFVRFLLVFAKPLKYPELSKCLCGCAAHASALVDLAAARRYDRRQVHYFRHASTRLQGTDCPSASRDVGGRFFSDRSGVQRVNGSRETALGMRSRL